MMKLTARIETRRGTRTEKMLVTAETVDFEKFKIRQTLQAGDVVTFKVTR